MDKVGRLNIGCGSDIIDGWVNLDLCNLPGVNVVHNLEELPLPFKDSEFDEILCRDILEHVDYIPILQDLHRIMIKSGKLKIRVTHFTSSISYTYPTHKNYFTSRTFDFFIKGGDREYYFEFAFNRMNLCRITLERSCLPGFWWMIYFIGLLERVVNSNRNWIYLYEDTFLSRIFPGRNVEVELVK